MIKLEYQALFKIAKENGLSEAEINQMESRIPELKQKILDRKVGFHQVIDDQKMVEDVKSLANELKGKYEYIAILGIGGSTLGMICLQQSLTHLYQASKPKLFVLDNIDPILLQDFLDSVDLKKTLFLVITKSGGTPETLAQYLFFKQQVIAAGLSFADHFVIITDPQKGLLRQQLNEMPELKSLPVPSNLGGRFSVLSAVGLLPAALIGLDIDQLIAGAKVIRDQMWQEKLADNLAYQLAVIQYLLYGKGKFINVNYTYSQKLIRFADWYKQLLGESIGKAKNNAGENVHVGITPLPVVGATDQHSQNQLFAEGPNDKLYLFLEAEKSPVDFEIPMEARFESELAYLKGVTFNQLFKTEMRGTFDALVQFERPAVKISIEEINEFNLGELLMFFEASIAYLGELMDVNAYDQPGVELSKNITREYLAK